MDMVALLHHGGRSGRWGSLGLWPAGDYASACAALARLHGQAADLRPGARVLAPGCGAGEELSLWRDEFGAAELIGIDPETSTDTVTAAGIRQVRGRASRMDAIAGVGFDAVLAHDSAYHFGAHADWLQAAARALRPGGRLVFSDLVLEPQGLAGRLSAPLLTRLLRQRPIAISELRSVPWIRHVLQTTGFVEIAVQRLDDAVLGGFVDFARAQRRDLGALARSTSWRPVTLTASALPVLRRLGLGYALFTANRR